METQGGGLNAEFRSERRLQLLAGLQELLDNIHPGGIPSAIWACFWLADLERLEALIEPGGRDELFLLLGTDVGPSFANGANVNIQPLALHRLLHRGPHLSHIAGVLATLEKQAGLYQEDTEDDSGKQPRSQPATPHAKRLCQDSDNQLTSVQMRCRYRDQSRCIITKSLDPVDVAYIFPYSMRRSLAGDNQHHLFWVLLRYFWTESRINAWTTAAFPAGSLDVVENVLCFAPTMYRWYSKGLFALQPIRQSEDKKEFTIKFYWLPLRKSAKNMSLLTKPTIPEDLVGIDGDYRAWNVRTGEEIASGQEIVLTTSDPENLSLPGWDLLELQWTLQRLTALSGAADAFPDAVEEDDSSGILWGDDASSPGQGIEPP
ncbi:hypothetical protein TESG_01567 [Trichophyton tonsurans CBS 112818]|uniref:HNH nuclease domain-containing protein n=1 Tax=Trichophyton tonsurans (strain CBS 112818) TaxID=647933 RepID=F2RRY0_TRIT1|nr:hypothetical protein TESG_01567 [Trichophyton tonsurans CBS 112818]